MRYYTERKTRGKLELDTELMIAPEEIVTTFTQLPIYIGTLQSLPINGIKVRWTAFGKPLPVRVKLKTASDGGRWYEVYKEEPASDEGVASEGGQLLVKLFYNNEKPGFSFPSQIVLLVGGNEMVMQKAEEN